MIGEKAKSLYHKLKQKEGEGSNAGEFNANQEWFGNFRKVWLKKSQDKRRSSFCWTRAADEFPDTIKKIIAQKGYLPEQVLNPD